MLKILVPVDGSECSDRAVDFLLKKARWYREGLEIHLLTVRHHMPYGRLAAAIEQQRVQEYQHEEGLKALASARAKLDAAGLPYTFHIGIGEPAEIIEQYARDKQCDQIVMGSHGRGRLGSMVLGSVATKVLHLSDVPVLLVK
jgi:nucleotide-binding universal stress UspA family protein